jgi:crotonobetainyl-CoA hydratase
MHLLPRQLPRKLALGMLIGGLELDALAAERHGLVNEVVATADLLPAAVVWAERIMRGSPIAVGTCLDVSERSVATPSLAEAMEARYESLDALSASEDFREGPRAFAEKRPPRWTS